MLRVQPTGEETKLNAAGLLVNLAAPFAIVTAWSHRRFILNKRSRTFSAVDSVQSLLALQRSADPETRPLQVSCDVCLPFFPGIFCQTEKVATFVRCFLFSLLSFFLSFFLSMPELSERLAPEFRGPLISLRPHGANHCSPCTIMHET